MKSDGNMQSFQQEISKNIRCDCMLVLVSLSAEIHSECSAKRGSHQFMIPSSKFLGDFEALTTHGNQVS